MKLKVRAFDPTTMRPGAVVLMIGKRGTGKSTLMRDIMYHMRHKLSFGIAMSPTEESTGDLTRYIPKSCIYAEFNGAAVDVMLEYQRRSVKKGSNPKYMYILLDDCMYDKAVMKATNIRQLFMNGRHRKIFFMAAVQYMMDLGPDLRTQVDYVFVLRENILSNREKLFKFFFGMFTDFKDFSKTMSKCTQGFDCMVLDNTVKSNEVSDCIFWYRANDKLPDFEMGAPGIWCLDAKYYRDKDNAKTEDDDEESTMDVNDAMRKHRHAHKVERGGGSDDEWTEPAAAAESRTTKIHAVEKRDRHGAPMR